MIYGISNTFGQAAGFMAPQTTGIILRNDNSHTNWLLSFWISAIIYLPGFLAFQLFSTDQVQSWALERDCEMKETASLKKAKSELLTEKQC